MKWMKVFDAQNMPQPLKDRFFRYYDHLGNNSFVHFYVKNGSANFGNEDFALQSEIDGWLLANGADAQEEILILCQW